MNVINWGDVPTWLGAVFAAAAAGAAVWTLASQRNQINEQRIFIAEQRALIGEQTATMEMERAELRAAAEDRRVAQARRVRMVARKAGATTDEQGAAVPDNYWVVEVRNDSDASLRDVEVRFGSAYNSAESYEWWPEQPRPEDRRGRSLMQLVELVGPGRIVRFLSQRYSPATVHNHPPVLFFSDENGARWALDARGDLQPTTQQPGNPPPAE